jgi:hypothetical protein
MVLCEERWPFESHCPTEYGVIDGEKKLEKDPSIVHQSLNMTLNLKNVQVQ